LQLLINAA